MRWARRLLIAAAVMMAAFAFLLVLLFTIDLGRFKGIVEDYVGWKTGREFHIAGTFEPSLGATFDLVVEGVTLSNAEWGTADNILELKRATISVDTWSLIWGPIDVLEFEVEGLDIHAERNPETLRHSWLFKGKPRRPPGTPRKRFELPLWLRTAQLEDISVTYGLGWFDAPRRVYVSAAEFYADDSDLLRMKLDGMINDAPVSGTGLVGPLRALIDGHEPRWELEVSIDQLRATTHGTFVDLFRAQGPTIYALMRGPAAEKTLAQLGLPPLATGPVDVEANLESVGDGLELSIEGAIGDLTANVTGRAKSLRTFRDMDLSLDIQGPNLQATAALFGGDFLPATPFLVKGDIRGRKDDLSLESVAMTVGDTKLEVDGRLVAPTVDADAELRLSASGPEILDFLPPVFRERVPSGAFEVLGTASGDPRLIRLSNFSARLSDFEFTAAGNVPLVSGPTGLDLVVNARGPDFEQVVEHWFEAGALAEPYVVSGRVRHDGEGYVVDDLDLEVKSAYLKIDGTTGVLPAMKGLDARVSLGGEDLQATLGSLVDVVLPSTSFGIDGKFAGRDGVLQLTGVEYRLGDARGTADGTTGQLPSLKGLQLDISLAGPDAARFGAAILGGEQSRFVPAEAFQARWSIARKDAAWAVNPWMLTIGNSRVEMRGTFRGARGLDLQFNASGPDLRLFLPDRDLDSPLPFQFDGGFGIEGDMIKFRQFDVQIAETRASFDGAVSTGAAKGDAEFELSVTGPSLATLGFVLGVPRLPDEAFRVQGSLTRTGQVYRFADLVADVGDSDISGDFTLEYGDKPSLSGRLASGHLDLATLLGREEPEPADDEQKKRLIPETALPLGLLDVANLDITLRLRHLETRDLDIGDVEFEVLMADDELHVTTGSASLTNGGDLSASLDLVRVGEAQADVSLGVTGDGIQLRRGIDSDGNPIQRPPEDLKMSFDATGGTLRELAASANGTFSLRQEEGEVDEAFTSLFMRDLASQIFSAINPFSRDEAQTHLECGFVELDVVDGVAHSRAIGFQTDKISVASVGTINLANEVMDLSFRIKQREGVGFSLAGVVNPYVKVGGTLGAPSFEFDTKRGLVSGTFAFLTGGLSVLAKGAWNRYLAKDNYCEAIIEAVDSGEMPVYTGEPESEQ